IVLAIAGQGCLRTRKPFPDLMELPFSSKISVAIPGSGFVAEPGFVGVAPGIGEIIVQPVSVCHQVSMIGQRSLPITWWYHIHAAGLMGSPTEPSKRIEERSRPSGHWSPCLMKARIAVGEV